MTRQVRVPAAEEVDATYARIAPFLVASPLIASPATGENCWLKLDALQPTGSFKIRGATAALTQLGQGAQVVTCSAGNHGLAVAHVARQLGTRATIVVSERASPRKIELLRRSAQELVLFGQTYDEAEAHARALAEQRGAHYLSPYNDPDVVLGQASVGIELLQRLDGAFTVVCSVGGGGLAAGVALALARRPGCKVIGVEAAQSCAVRAALEHGRVVPIEVGPTLAEGLAGNLEDGTMTVELLARSEVQLLTVSEAQIARAMRQLAQAHGLLVEGAGATAAAAVLAGLVPHDARTPLVVVVSGRNVELGTWSRAVESAAPAEPAVSGADGREALRMKS